MKHERTNPYNLALRAFHRYMERPAESENMEAIQDIADEIAAHVVDMKQDDAFILSYVTKTYGEAAAQKWIRLIKENA